MIHTNMARAPKLWEHLVVNRTIFGDGVELSGNNFSEEVAFQLRLESVSQVKKD